MDTMYRKQIALAEPEISLESSDPVPSYDALATAVIVQEFGKYFPTSKLMDRIKRWPINLAEKAIEESPAVAAKLREKGKKHERKRHAILVTMVDLIIQKRENPNAILTTPLDLLEAHEFRQRRKMRFIRKYFSQVLPPRNRKSKPRNKTKQAKKDQKKKEKRKQQAKKERDARRLVCSKSGIAKSSTSASSSKSMTVYNRQH